MADKGEYRGVYVALLDSWEFQELSACARACLFALKLKLGLAGIDVFAPETLPRYTGFSASECEEAVDELRAADWIRSERNVYWIRNGLRFDPTDPLSSPNQRKGIESQLKRLPALKIVAEFARYYDLPEPPVQTGRRKGSERVPEPLRSTETETETETENPPGVAHAREPVDPESLDQDEEPLPDVPADRGAKVVPLRPAVAPDALPFGGLDWEGRTSGAVVLREWIRLQPAPPGRSDRDRFGAACKRIADEHTTGEIALAFLGIGALWPHAPPNSEPWTPEHLRKRFVEALAAAAKHPVLARMREDAAFDEAFEHATTGGG